MSIYKTIKAWFKSDVKPDKIRIRIKNNIILRVYYPASYDRMETAMLNQQVSCYQHKLNEAAGIKNGGIGLSNGGFANA